MKTRREQSHDLSLFFARSKTIRINKNVVTIATLHSGNNCSAFKASFMEVLFRCTVSLASAPRLRTVPATISGA